MRYLIIPLLATGALVLSTAPAYADLGDQLAKLLADDGAAGDSFGISVAISGATAIVGADLNDDLGSYSGSAYLFDIISGQQIVKLLPDDGTENDSFGNSVAISGTITIVGAELAGDKGLGPGFAYLFDTTTGQQIFKLLADDGAVGDEFGCSVAISGLTAIVGADLVDDNGTNSGSAYLFDTTTGRQLFKLLPNDGADFDRFGWSVAISGTTAIIGADLVDDNGTNSGSAYLFDTGTGRQLFKLLAEDSEEADRFGVSVAISGTIAIVGANNDNDNGINSGSAYLFDTTTGQQLFKLLAEDGEAGDQFGLSVAISGTTAIVGAHRDDDNGSNSGSAYLFDTTTGQQIAKLLPSDGALYERFGWSVAINSDTAIVGAIEDDDNGFNSGSAYLFDAADTPPCPADLNEDGSVGVSDLLILLGFWGPCSPVCLGDLDGDRNVGVKDLLTLLGAWGPCP